MAKDDAQFTFERVTPQSEAGGYRFSVRGKSIHLLKQNLQCLSDEIVRHLASFALLQADDKREPDDA